MDVFCYVFFFTMRMVIVIVLFMPSKTGTAEDQRTRQSNWGKQGENQMKWVPEGTHSDSSGMISDRFEGAG